jgi:phosphoribosylaminoimidazolecarboxamide formyltransferase/IMP cyclohydrolase
MAAAPRVHRALLSVFDKTGLVEFARALHDEFGIELISTGGTAATLRQAGLPVTLVEEVTGFPELLDGRVKTLHPRIHAALLADRDNPEHMRQLEAQGIAPIDMVVVNLYPFEETVARPDCTDAEAIEMIDIGGPCLLRAAAKNHRHVRIVADPLRYDEVLRELRGEQTQPEWAPDERRMTAADVFEQTSQYDAQVMKWLGRGLDPDGLWPWGEALYFRNWGALRYGENPHQTAELLETPDEDGDLSLPTADAFVENDVEMSFNNYLDAHAAVGLCSELARAGRQLAAGPAPGSGAAPLVACFIKHTNACGAAVATPVDESPAARQAALIDAYQRAYLGDPNAAMGGILAVNEPVTAEFAAVVMETFARFGKPLREAGAAHAPGGFFVEVWAAPSFTPEAVAVIRGTAEPTAELPHPPRKDWGQRVRLLAVDDMARAPEPEEVDLKRIAGGLLRQTRDLVGLNEEAWQVVTKRPPTPQELADLRLAWLVCKHTKSNAITICRDGMLLGNGAGQMSRVMSCRIATWLAAENGHGEKLRGSVAASDAFFPFADGPAQLLDAGVTALIQPGGGKRDAEVVAACDARGVAMILTGTRHFRH